MKNLIYFFTLILILNCSCSSEKKTYSLQQLNLNIPSDPATLDPRKGGDVISSTFHFLLFDGLVRGNPDGSLTLSLAESYEISPDQKTYLFQLRDCYWSNGKPITAHDFEKSWKDVLDPAFPSLNAHLMFPIKNAEKAKRDQCALSEVGVRALDDKLLEVVLEQPVPYFLELVSFCVFFPISKEIDEAHKNWENQVGEHFVCSGPFILKSWKHDNEIYLAKNESYHRKDEIQLDSIHYSMVKNEMTALQMFEKGEIDILGQPVLPLPADSLPDLIKKKLIKTRPMAATTFCAFNVNKFPFQNVHIRKAFALAINRQQIVNNITLLNEKIALEMIPPILKKKYLVHFFDDADLEQAKFLLQKGCDELGISKENFPEVTYYYSTSELHHKIAQAVQQQWLKNLGIKVKIENFDHKILMQKLYKKDFLLAQAYWIAQYNDPMNILERFKFKENTKNYPDWEDPEYIRLLNESGKASITEEMRRKLLHEAEKIFMDQMPIAPIFHWSSAFIAKPYVKSFDLALLGNGYFEKIYIDLKEKASTR